MKNALRSRLALTLLTGALVLLLVPIAVAAAGTRSDTHKPPYKKGVQGGDNANFIYADPASGREMVLRAYPGYNPFTCGDSKGGYVSLRLPVKVTKRIASVEVDYANALVDPYSFMTASVRDLKRNLFLGSKEMRGPVTGSGAISVPLDTPALRGSTVVVDFGLEVPSACPNAEVAEAEFTQVIVKHA
ncbi:MAG: hypothetical protein ABR600_06755 [Actinomycetota bacterium]